MAVAPPTRPSPRKYFKKVVRPLVTKCYPVVQKGVQVKANSGKVAPDAFPSVVYRVVAPRSLKTQRGVFLEAEAILFDVRAKRYDKAVELSKKILKALVEGKRTTELITLVEDYDDTSNVYIVSSTVLVRV